MSARYASSTSRTVAPDQHSALGAPRQHLRFSTVEVGSANWAHRDPQSTSSHGRAIAPYNGAVKTAAKRYNSDASF